MANNRELSQLGSIIVVDDSNRNLGIGTTDPNAVVGVGNTAKLSVGILSAYQLYGDATNLTGITPGQVGALANVVEDTEPQLGGDLDVNGNDITGIGSVNLTGIVTATTFSGSGASLTNIPNSALDNSTVSYGGVQVSLGGTDATPAFDLQDATNYPYSSLTGITTEIVGDTTPQLGGDLDVNNNNITGTGNVNLNGIVTATSFTGDLTGTATTATALETARNFEITGDIVASAISFDGTGNVSLAATIQPDSVAMGTDTTGDYVESVSGTANEISVTGGTGEGSTPTIGFVANPTIGGNVTIGQDLTVTRDLQVTRNLSVDGTVTIGGTSATIFAETLKISDPDLVLGFRTDASGNDISNDSTASHGGVALASTEGSPIVSLIGAGETLPVTYKKIMWFKTSSFAGLSTDAWLTNYAFGVGTTSMSAGTKFAVGNIEADFDDITAVRNINSTGIITATAFDGSLATTDLTGTITNAQLAGSIENSKLSNSTVSYGGVQLSLGDSDATPAFNLQDATNYPYTSLTGITTEIVGDTTPQLGGDLDVNGNDITGTGNVNLTGVITATSFVKASNSGGFLKADGIEDTNTYLTSYTETQTLDDVVGLGSDTTQTITVGTATTGVVVRPDGTLNVSGVSTFQNDINVGFGKSILWDTFDNFHITTTGSGAGLVETNGELYFGTTHLYIQNPGGSTTMAEFIQDGAVKLNHNNSTKLQTHDYGIDVTGHTETDTLNVSGISTLGNVKISSGIVTASSGIVTYYGDGSCLTNLPSAGFLADAQENLYAGTSAGASSDADTCFNIGIGYSAGASLNSGDLNIFLGCCAGNSTTDGGHNIFLGSKAGANHTSGYFNIAIGNCANASGTTTGQYNVFIGCSAGDCVTSGCDNVYLGRGAGKCVTTARCNIALGFFAGHKNLSGTDNVFLGRNAGGNSTSGNNNVSIGERAGFGNAGGDYNNFIGHYAGYYNTTGCSNNYFGCTAGYCNCTGSGNNIFGDRAGFDLGSGSNNVFIGYYSGNLQTSGDCNIAIGHCAELPNKTGSSQLAIGAGNTNWIAGDSSYNVTIAGIVTVTSTGIVSATKFCGDGSCLTGINAGFDPDAQENLYAGTSAGASSDADTCCNVALGLFAGYTLNSGDNNVFLGTRAGQHATSGYSSIFIGKCAGASGTVTGGFNIALGDGAGKSLTGGNYNFLAGYNAGCNQTSTSCNIKIGYNAGKSGTGNDVVALGAGAGQYNTSASNLILIGKGAGKCVSTGSQNIFLGYFAAGIGTVTGNYNLALGAFAGQDLTSGDYNIFLGSYTGCKITSSSDNIMMGRAVGAASSATPCANIVMGVEAGYNMHNACKNIMLGYQVGCDVEGHCNIFLGYQAGTNVTSGNNNIFLGTCAAQLCAVTGGNNIALGFQSGLKLTSGGANVNIGYQSGKCNDTGTANVFIGGRAGHYATGNRNVVIGCGAALNMDNGNCNVFIGYYSGQASNNNPTDNNAIGRCSLLNLNNGDKNSVLGTKAGEQTLAGSCNIFLGMCAGYSNTNGCSNTFIGYQSGNTNTTGCCNVAIGRDVELPSATGNNQLAIGDGTNRWITGDSSFNVGFGTTNPSGAADTNNTQIVNAGIVTANYFYGDGSNLTNVPGFEPDAGGNFFAGTNAGGGYDPTTGSSYYNIIIGNNAGQKLPDGTTSGGDHNVLLGLSAGGCTTTGCQNVFIGRCAGFGNNAVTGPNNTAIGCKAGYCLTSGKYNNFFGREAGLKNTSGSFNNFFGNSAGDANTTGCFNNYFGDAAGTNTLTSCHNNFFGRAAGGGTHTGCYNNYFGYSAGYGISNATGSHNTFFGKDAGKCINTGDDNVFLGYESGKGTATGVSGDGNLAIGRCSGTAITSGSNNTFVGKYSGLSLTSGTYNIAFGYCAGKSVTTGEHNFFVGADAGCDTTGCRNIFLGRHAGRTFTSGNKNVYIGDCAGGQTGTKTGSSNVAIGVGAGAQGSSNFSQNVFLGHYSAAGGNSTGHGNAFLGAYTGFTLTSGCCNIFIGKCAGNTNTSGNFNVAIGVDVELPSATGNGQFAIGCGTNRWIYGDSSYNIYDKDGNQLNGASSGGGGLWSQTSVGIHTLSCVGIGTTNPQSKLEINVGTAVSAFDIQGSAGQLFSVTNNLTSGSIFSVNDVSGIPSIDVDADGTIQLAPYSTTEFVGVGITNPTTKLHVVGEVTATDFNSTSDSRLKTNVQVIDDPLAKVLQINGVSFNWIENNKPSMGVIADNIEEVVPELVSDTDPKTVNYNGLIGLLIEVVKEQQTQIDSLNERLSRLE